MLSRQYRTAWTAYQNAVAIYRLEEENQVYAKENLDIQQARFRVGIASSLEIREAENSYVSTLARLNGAAYNVKLNETRVLEIEARLARLKPIDRMPRKRQMLEVIITNVIAEMVQRRRSPDRMVRQARQV